MNKLKNIINETIQKIICLESDKKLKWVKEFNIKRKETFLYCKINDKLKIDVHIYIDDNKNIQDNSYIYLHTPKLNYYDECELTQYYKSSSSSFTSEFSKRIIDMLYEDTITYKIEEAKKNDKLALENLFN